MSKYRDHPIYYINDWIEYELRVRSIVPPLSDYVTDLSDRDSENVPVPLFIPAQQSAEATTPYNNDYSSLPFAVYNTTIEHNVFMIEGNVSYIWYDNDVDRMLEIANFVSRLVAREDMSASDLNSKFSASSEYPYDFKYLELDQMSGPSEMVDEAGRYAMVIAITYCCTYEGIERNETILQPQDIGMFETSAEITNLRANYSE